MADQTKSTAKLIVAEKLGTKKEPEEKKSDEGKLSAAEDLIQAVKSGDAQGVADALSAFIDLSGSEPDDDEKE